MPTTELQRLLIFDTHRPGTLFKPISRTRRHLVVNPAGSAASAPAAAAVGGYGSPGRVAAWWRALASSGWLSTMPFNVSRVASALTVKSPSGRRQARRTRRRCSRASGSVSAPAPAVDDDAGTAAAAAVALSVAGTVGGERPSLEATVATPARTVDSKPAEGGSGRLERGKVIGRRINERRGHMAGATHAWKTNTKIHSMEALLHVAPISASHAKRETTRTGRGDRHRATSRGRY